MPFVPRRIGSSPVFGYVRLNGIPINSKNASASLSVRAELTSVTLSPCTRLSLSAFTSVPCCSGFTYVIEQSAGHPHTWTSICISIRPCRSGFLQFGPAQNRGGEDIREDVVHLFFQQHELSEYGQELADFG